MNINDILEEMPQLIPGVNQSEIELAVKDCVKSLANNRARKLNQYGTSTFLYQYEKDTSTGLYFLATGDRIDYLVRYKRVTLPGEVQGARQVLIKRFSTANAAAAGIGAEIFWNHIFQMQGCVVSDSQQTSDGRAFWEYRIKEAIQKGLTVKMTDTNLNTSVVIHTMDNLIDLSSDIWGSSKWFQRIVLVITK